MGKCPRIALPSNRKVVVITFLAYPNLTAANHSKLRVFCPASREKNTHTFVYIGISVFYLSPLLHDLSGGGGEKFTIKSVKFVFVRVMHLHYYINKAFLGNQ